MAKISVLRGSVVYADTDAIVNAANAQLAGGSGVCGAIFEEAGWGDMQQACDRIGGCPTGEAVSTPGFKLKAKYVIHAVGPIYAGRPRDAELLRSAYRSCLEEAEKLGLHSIGFCSISTGIYGYPLNEAVKIAADTLRTFPAKSLTDIRVYCYGERRVPGIHQSARINLSRFTPKNHVTIDPVIDWGGSSMGRGRLGSQQGMQRTIAARQQTTRYQVSALRSMDDAHLSVALDDIFDNTPVESNQQDADTQRFFNAIGWSDELPEVVDESTFARAALAARHRDGRSFQMLFHTDSPSKKYQMQKLLVTNS